MSKYDKVKAYFDAGLWNLSRVRHAVLKGWISPKQYRIITGENYDVQA